MEQTLKNSIDKSASLSRIVSLVAIVLVAGALLVVWMSTRKPGYDFEEPPAVYPLARHVKYGMTLQNLTSRTLDKASVWIYAPVGKAASQKTTQLQVSRQHKIFDDAFGNRLVYFEFENVAADAAPYINIEARVRLAQEPNPISDADINRFLEEERFIQANAPEIRQLAEDLKSESAAKTVENILAWFAEQPEETDPAEEQLAQETAMESVAPGFEKKVAEVEAGALEVLNKKHRSKSGDLYLFLALCRAAGIPTRGVVGFSLADKDELTAEDALVWAEFRDGDQWRIADLAQHSIAEQPANYLAFRIIDRISVPAGWVPRAFLYDAAGLAPVPGSIKLRALDRKQ